MARDYAALLRYIAERSGVPFKWGKHANDCAAYAAGAVMAQTGRDVIAGLTWRGQKSAREVLAQGGGLEAIVSSLLRPIPVAHARRGDIAGVRQGEELVLMVIEGHTLVGPGNMRAPRRAMSLAWSAD